MNRRNVIGGLAGILAAGFAPAAIGGGVLMPVRKLVVPSGIDSRPYGAGSVVGGWQLQVGDRITMRGAVDCEWVVASKGANGVAQLVKCPR